MKPITPRQRSILLKLTLGWELRRGDDPSLAPPTDAIIIAPGGSQALPVATTTLDELITAGLVEPDERRGAVRIHVLTDAGHLALATEPSP